MTDESTTGPGETTGSPPRAGWLLLVVCVGSFVTALDTTVLNIALPSLRASLDASASELQWIVSVYPLVFAALIFLGGSLGDVHGHRRVLLGGFALFGVGSAVAALSSTALALVVGRILSGAGAGFLTPAALALVSVNFTGTARPRAVSLTSAATGLAVAVGPVLGGVLVGSLGWQSVFWINVPIVLFGIVAGFLVVPETPVVAGRRIDTLGVVLASVGFVALLAGSIEAGQGGAIVWWAGPLLVAAVVLGWFVVHERRASQPMLDLGLFRNHMFTGGVLLGVILQIAVSAAFMFMAIYYQSVRGDSPLTTGLFYVPTTITIVILAPFVGILASRRGLRLPAMVGSVCSTAGGLLLMTLHVDTPAVVLILAQLLFGVGIAFLTIPLTTAILNGAPSSEAGIASASNNVAQRLGNAIGVGLLGSVLAVVARSSFTRSLDALGITGAAASDALANFHGMDPPTGATSPIDVATVDAFVTGLAVVMGIGALVNALGILVSWRFLPGREAETADTGSP